MEIFKELNNLGYKQHLPMTVEELDTLSIDSVEFSIEANLVFDWFRDKYDLHSEIRSYTSGKFTFVIQKLEATVKYLHYGGINFVYSSYEEARKACLGKLIELCKNLKL